MTEPKSNWGGSRPGSGRPRLAASISRLSVTMPTELLVILKDLAERDGVSVSEFLRVGIRKYAGERRAAYLLDEK